MKEKSIKFIKRSFAWLLVLVVAYVVLYSYVNPEELVYREETIQPFTDPKDYDIPTEPLIKKSNPFVYYVLEFQGWLFFIAIIYLFSDIKGNKKLIEKIKTFIKNKDKKNNRE